MIKPFVKFLFCWVLAPLTALFITPVAAQDWPIYKGNHLFTGNNDELIVPNPNLQWVFRAKRHIQNPIISEGRLYFLDYDQNIYCVEQQSGVLLWQNSLPAIAKEFRDGGRIVGKVKYPVIRDKFLFLTDNISIYALNKNSGRVIWARTGLQQESYQSKNQFQQKNQYMVASIYSDPSILDDMIFYGTRDVFVARNIHNGQELWRNNDIISFAGFATFYDQFIFTLSVDYVKNSYKILKLHRDSGRSLWQAELPKPLRLFSPVVYQDKLFMPLNDEIIAFANSNGKMLWRQKYSDIVTSNLSFTDSELLFSKGNRSIAVVDPESGKQKREIFLKEQASPFFVTTRDQLYVAYTDVQDVQDGAGSSALKEAPKTVKKTYTKVQAYNFSDGKMLWNFSSVCEGPPAQIVSSNGTLYVPAGNYLYAIGGEHSNFVALEQKKLIDSLCVHYDEQKNKTDQDKKQQEDNQQKKNFYDEKGNKKITIEFENLNNLSYELELEVLRDGKVIDKKNFMLSDKNKQIEVPDGEHRLTFKHQDYLNQSKVIGKDQSSVKFDPHKIEQGKKITADDIYFELDSSYLKKESLDLLQNLIASLKRRPALKLTVIGHTDASGDLAHNMNLSQKRAESVTDYLLKNGISAERLKAVGKGPHEPIADNKTAEGRQKNRRTEFTFE